MIDKRARETLVHLVQVYQGLRQALDVQVVGYDEFKDALIIAHFKRILGLRGHLMVFGPPGVGKTAATKTLARLLAEVNGGQPCYVRTSGRSDLMPEEILAEREALTFNHLLSAHRPALIWRSCYIR